MGTRLLYTQITMLLYIIPISWWSLISLVAAGPGEGGPQLRREVTLIPGYDIPMQIMAEILADNNVLHQSPSRKEVPVTTRDNVSRRSDVAVSQGTGGSSRDLVFSILSEDARRKAMGEISSHDGVRVERNVFNSPPQRQDKKSQCTTQPRFSLTQAL